MVSAEVCCEAGGLGQGRVGPVLKQIRNHNVKVGVQYTIPLQKFAWKLLYAAV